jgi:hypothetical protein
MSPPLARTARLSTSAIRDMLRARVGQEWHAGDRLPPVKSLARYLGAGQSATNRAVQDLVREGLLTSRRRSGTVVANPHAGRPTLLNKTVLVVCGVPGSTSRFVDEIVRALGATVESASGRLERASAAPGSSTELPPHDVIVLVNPYVPTIQLFAGAAPLVIVSTSLDHLQLPALDYDLVGVDHRQGAALAGRHLRAAGVSEACFIGRQERGGNYDPTSTHRLAGFEAGWGRSVPRTHQIDCEGYSITAGGRGLRRYLALNKRPRAVFAVTDEIALGFLAAAASHGLEPVRDFLLVGFDGFEQTLDERDRTLTTLDVPLQEMGRRAGELLITRLSQPQSPPQRIYLGCRLYVGKTTR